MGLGRAASDATNLPVVHPLACARFLFPWFVRLQPCLGPTPSWLHLDSGQIKPVTLILTLEVKLVLKLEKLHTRIIGNLNISHGCENW